MRLDTGQILDEYRVLGDNGETVHVSSTVRAYNAAADRWELQPDRFSWTADRSTDGGKTWVKDFQRIEARRIGPSRAMGPLAPAKKP